MTRTIVQEYGPIYGEPVNGTVMGRPNGSVYVPTTNTIKLEIPENIRFLRYYDDVYLWNCLSDGTYSNYLNPQIFPIYSAESQDLSNNMQMQLFSDAELTTMICSRDLPAGEFNLKRGQFNDAPAGLTDGQTLYCRAQLMNNGVAIATSDTIPVVMVVLE